MRPGRPSPPRPRASGGPACRAGRPSSSRRGVDRRRVVRVGDRAARLGRGRRRVPGSSSRPSSWPLLAQPVEVDGLVGEDVRLVAEDVVEAPQLLVEEARRPGGREHEARAAAPRCSAACGRTAARASCGPAPASRARAARRPSGTRSRRRTGRGRRRPGPSSVNASSSDGRASFWLSTPVPPSYTHSDESPIGPSVGEISDWIITCSPSTSTSSPFSGLTNEVNPQSRSASSSSVVGNSGSSTVAFFDTCLRRCSGSKWSRCRWETNR